MKETTAIRPRMTTGFKIKTYHNRVNEHTHAKKLHPIGLAYKEEVVNKTFQSTSRSERIIARLPNS